MPTALELLYVITPAVLALPVLALAPRPRAPPIELPGIRAVTVKTVTPRRTFILVTLAALAATYAAECVLLILDLVFTPFRHSPHDHSPWFVGASVVHALGGVTVYALAAILAEWRTRWGDKTLVLLALIAFGLEVPTLVLSIINEVHAPRGNRLYDILLIPPSALRLLLLPVLLVLVLSPVVKFQPATEATSLLEDDDEDEQAEGSLAGPSASANGSKGYGTFDSDLGSGETSTTPAIGTPQPKTKDRKPVIPKKLGQGKTEETPGISWTEFWARIWRLRSRLWPSTSWRLQLTCYLSFAFLGAGTVVFAYTPYALGKLVDALTARESGRMGMSPWPWLAMWIGLRALSGGGLLTFLQVILWIPVQQYADREMQMLLFDHLLNLSLKFHTKRNTGEVLKIIDQGSSINNLLETLMFSAVPTLVEVVVTFFIFLGLYGGSLATVLGVVVVTYVVFSVTFTSFRTRLRRQANERAVKMRGISSDVLMNWESVKYFTAEARESRRFQESVLSYQDLEYRVQFSFSLLHLVQTFIITMAFLAGSLIIANRIFRGTATVGSFVQYLQYLQQLYGPLNRLSFLYRQLNSQATDAEKLFNLLGQAVEIRDQPGAKDLVITDGVIEFDNVHFSYDGEVQALKGVSFRIGKGESMALVGESGSGKSTILRLLFRFYDIDSGTIYIDGQDISRVTQKSLRHAIGIVPQDSVLWNDTIGANISYGREGATDEEIIAAAKAARLHDRIMSFPEGYETIVGERGVRLSGGEKQRVSLARMFLKNPAILVLDEATSALDTETEREIQRSLAELAQNRSSLSIAHRLSTIINSNQIVVLKNGAVIENGTYQQLVEADGHFAAMWKKQIFTEAEMLAQTEGNAPAAMIAAAEGLVAGEDETLHIHRASPPSTVHEHSEDGGASGVASDAESSKSKRSKASKMSKASKSSKGKSAEGANGDEAETPRAEAPSVLEAQDDEHDKPVPEIEVRDEDNNSDPKPTPRSEDKDAVGRSVPDATVGSASFAQVAASSPSSSAPIAAGPSSSTPSRLPAPAPTSAFPPPPDMARSTSTASSHLRGGSRTSEDSVAPDVKDKDKDKESKRRKRLSSIKGFVRRMSDQGKPLSRSNSQRSNNNDSDSERRDKK